MPTDVARPANASEMAPDAPAASVLPIERSVYRASGGTRRKAFAITLLIHVAAIAIIAIRWSSPALQVAPSAPLTVSLLPLASPPETDKAQKEQKPKRQRTERRLPPQVEPIERAVTPVAITTSTPPLLEVPPIESVPRQPEDAAPKTSAAPSAPQPRSNAPDSWEGRVLARLEAFRRYPANARSARQQGVVHIRFRINRAGRVLSAALVRSSGYPALDRAALDTLRRADPLPKIPADRPDEIELSVPVEFFLS